jgi:hypothetical protein
MTVYGYDISNHDWDRARAAGRAGVSLADARKAGISFVTHKATEGSPASGQYADPYFDDFARQLAHVAFPVAGSYHAAHAGHPLAQADFWFDTVTAKYPGWRDHPCWIWQIDAEPLDGYRAPSKADVLAIGRHLEAKGVARGQIVVYGPRWVYGNELTGIPWRLWASAYTQEARPFKHVYPGDDAAGWGPYSGQTPLILQFSSVTSIGAQHECDANAVRVPDEAALVRLFKPSKEFTVDAKSRQEIQTMLDAHRAVVKGDVETLLAEALVAVRDGSEHGPFTRKRHPVLLAAGKSLQALFGRTPPPPATH